jgi:nicotinamidase-related amidase
MEPKTALLVIDVQIGLMDFPVYQRDEVLTRINQLLAQARATATPVIYIQHDGSEAGDPLEPQTPGWPIHPAIAPQPGEPVIRKTAGDAFFETSLQTELEQRGITHLVIAGAQTEYCIDTSCRSAIGRGFDVTLAADAHTTIDNETLTAAQTIRHHNHLLNGFQAGTHQLTVQPIADINFARQA